MEPFVIIRLVGGLLGAFIITWGFLDYRRCRISRFETSLRWLVGIPLIVVSIRPDTVNFLISVLAMDKMVFGRMIGLLVLSTIALWVLVLHERGRRFSLEYNYDILVRKSLLRDALTSQSVQGLQGKDILIGLPALNEAENLKALLKDIPETVAGRSVGVLVIDDGSSDETAAVVRGARQAVISSYMRRGQGAALRIVYEAAFALTPLVVVTMDADGQHLPNEIERLVTPILDGSKDLVIGSRILGTREPDSRFRLFGIYVFNALTNFLANTTITDCSSGFKAFRVEALKTVHLRENQFQSAEVLISSARAGLRIGEVPITVLRRKSGTSRKGTNFHYGLNFIRTIFKSWWRPTSLD